MTTARAGGMEADAGGAQAIVVAEVQRSWSDALVLCERLPLVPVTVNVVRLNRSPDHVNVNVDEEVAGLGENDPLTPAGRPVTLRLTAPEKPLLGVMVTV